MLLWPIKEVETLRRNKVELSNKKLVKGEMVEIKGITVAQVYSFSPSDDATTFTLMLSSLSVFTWQADVEVTFSFDGLDKAEPFDPKWDRYDAEKVCDEMNSTIPGGLGPFGILTLASKKLEEYTPIFFRIFKAQDEHLVLMCSDARRLICLPIMQRICSKRLIYK